MKKLIYFFLITSMISCSTNNCLATYTAQEISKNKKYNIISIINKRKLDNSRTLKTYFGINRGKYNTRAKSFNEEDFEYMIKNLKSDSINYEKNKELIVLERLKLQKKHYDEKKFNILKKEINDLIEFWSDKDIKRMGFKNKSSNNDKNQNNIFEYSFSEPILTKNNKKALFSVSISKKNQNSYEDFLIIMQKTNGKWVFLEKVESSILH